MYCSKRAKLTYCKTFKTLSEFASYSKRTNRSFSRTAAFHIYQPSKQRDYLKTYYKDQDNEDEF